jgi:hypothetical protein
VTRLGITYGVLRRLGFSQDRVDECLRAIQGVDLEEAYEWVRPSSTPRIGAYIVTALRLLLGRRT